MTDKCQEVREARREAKGLKLTISQLRSEIQNTQKNGVRVWPFVQILPQALDGGRCIRIECPGVEAERIELEPLPNGVSVRINTSHLSSSQQEFEQKFRFNDDEEGILEFRHEEVSYENGVLLLVLRPLACQKMKLRSTHKQVSVGPMCLRYLPEASSDYTWKDKCEPDMVSLASVNSNDTVSEIGTDVFFAGGSVVPSLGGNVHRSEAADAESCHGSVISQESCNFGSQLEEGSPHKAGDFVTGC